MKKTIVFLAAMLGLSLAAGAGAGAVVNPGVAQPSGTETFETTLVSLDRPAGAITGTLRLTVSPDGIVQGWFRDQDRGDLRTVTGGVSGDHIWLQIGAFHGLHIDGTYRNGVIAGYTLLGEQNFKFEATPSA